MSTKRYVKTLISLSLIIILVFPSFAFMEGTSLSTLFTVDLSSLSDEELVQAAEAIRAEQRARIKTHISLDSNELIMFIGKSQKIEAKIVDLPEGEKTPKCEWTTSDKSIAIYNNGSIKANGAGKAVITCSATLLDGTQISTDCIVTVNVPVSSVSTDKRNITLEVPNSYTPVFTVKPNNATNKGLKFVSSDPAIASVDQQGKITGVGKGKATITVTTIDGTDKSLSITVNVEDNRDSIGKRTSIITGNKTHGYLEILASYPSFEKIIKDDILSSVTSIMIANILLHADNSIGIDFAHNKDVIFLGPSKKDKAICYMALRDEDAKYWMVIVEPASNKITYSKDKKTEAEAIQFMEYNCTAYRMVTGQQVVDAYNTYLIE